ncbi:MAG TPA: hypothetical protein DCP91_11455 [Eggerthellaceae bacterium]|nr:hypothetical protein [Eggerthellaceae bacterium]
MAAMDKGSAAQGVIYLAACAVNGVVPDARLVGDMDLPLVLGVARDHMLAAAAAMALRSAGLDDPDFARAEASAVRRAVVMGAERDELLSRMDSAGIWHLPMKGIVIQRLYPALGMREMSDNDVLFDASRAADVREIMEGMGFRTESFGRWNNDVYYKEPLCNFEMHRLLFLPIDGQPVYDYYRDAERLLVPDGDGSFGMHLSDEDFYVHMVAHEHKHYAYAGTGLRSLLDVYVWVRAKGGALDWGRVSGELAKMGLAEFEARNRRLAMRLFGGAELSAEDEEMLGYFVSSGTYGTTAQGVQNMVAQRGRLGFLAWRAFPSYETMAILYPVLGKAPILLPVCWAARIASALAAKCIR